MLSDNGFKIKKQLEELGQLKRKVRNLDCQLREILELGELPIKYSFNGAPKKTTSTISKQERYLLKVESLKNKIENTIDEILTVEDKLTILIENLDTLSYNLIAERYINCISLKEISKEFNYSISHVRRLYDMVFEKLAENKLKLSANEHK